MGKFALFLTIAVLGTTAMAFGQNGLGGDVFISLDNVTNLYSPTQLRAGNSHTFSIRFDATAATSGALFCGLNGFEVYSPDGADWIGLQAAHGPLSLDKCQRPWLWHYQYDGATFARTGSSGTLPCAGYTPGVCEKAGFVIAITLSAASSAPDCTYWWEGGVDNGIALTATITSRAEDDGLHLCLDSVSGQGMQTWEWYYGLWDANVFWDNGLGESGPRCFEVYDVPNMPPVWDIDPLVAGISGNHCDEFAYTFAAHDVDDVPNETPVITYSFAPGFETGYGTLDGNIWSWSGYTVPQSGVLDVQFLASDGRDFTETPFTVHVAIENNPPTIACPGGEVRVIDAMTKTQTVTISDPDDCDVDGLVLSVGTVVGGDPGDVINIIGNVISFTPAGGIERHVIMTVMVADAGGLTATCELFWFVSPGGGPYQVEITSDPMAIQGGYADIDLVLHYAEANEGIAGFDFLLAYDATAISFQSAEGGAIYDSCGWEYFTYRYGTNDICEGDCPSGLLGVTGIAEAYGGPHHPTCDVGHAGYVEWTRLPISLASLRFLITNDRAFECQYVPVRFFWTDCTDNAISNYDGSLLFLSDKVFEFTEYNYPFASGQIEGTYAFPTHGGTQETLMAEDCYFEDEQHGEFACAGVAFQNGGLDLACPGPLDACGDINLNGLAYEIADAVMFANYFVEGPTAAFGDHYDGSEAASDCNGDGLALTVPDLVYLIRVVIGDAQAIPKTNPLAAKFEVAGDTYRIDTEAGAAYLVFEGSVTPTLLAENMKMQFAVVNGNTNVLIFRDDVANESFVGDFVRANGRLITSEFATYDGQPIVAKLIPSSFAVEQNYPNPFNPTTNISFNIPVEGTAWKLDVYNIGGQVVKTFSGVSEGGVETVTWDASGKASGIYFYKVTAGDNYETRKAVLIK